MSATELLHAIVGGTLTGGVYALIQGKTILLVEQNARAGLKLSSRGVVLENGMVRLTGSGREVLEHPEIAALYLGGAVSTEEE